ncbi:cytidine deaminase [Gordonia sp. PKS22-38]|uniref:Cytidine deaminase n=1 Tax=Gordonia prachuapensis TaxID=3115651 RepID=A0ABU7MRH7_9ACTN|nr:cytidine deaminase [Gordonia sp. PKS22-38]
MPAEVDWKLLRDNAQAMIGRAYAPYSGFPVGAGGLTTEGRVVRGCNVENVSYGLGICAEVALVANLVSAGRQRLVAVSVCDARGAILMPCGRCRQVLLEHGGPEVVVDHPDGPRRLAELLPDAFGPDDLEASR